MAGRTIDLGWMRIFAAIGRSGSLSSAAAALGLTQPAVSYQIRRIEEQIGVSLFRRQHRGVELTPEGQQLYDIVSRGVGDIDQLVGRLRAGAQRPVIRLRTDYAFSALWLIPRIQGFRQLHPEVDIQIVAMQHTERDQLEEGDVAVVFGSWADYRRDAVLLIPERVAPVCARGFRDQNLASDDPAVLAQARLIHLDAHGSPPWFDWKSYFTTFGIRRDDQSGQGDVSFNTYSLVVQAALGEQGLAIGWMGLVDPFLASGMLVKAGPELEARDRGYWLLQPAGQTEIGAHLAAWLMAEAGMGPVQPAAPAG